MPETVFGLPLHPLVVHGAAASSSSGFDLGDRGRRQPGTAGAVGLAHLVTDHCRTGRHRDSPALGQQPRGVALPGDPARVRAQHADYGASAVWFVLGLWLAVSAVLLLDVDRKRRDGFGSPVFPAVLAVVAIIAAMAATGQVLLTVWTGSEAHWQPRVEVQR